MSHFALFQLYIMYLRKTALHVCDRSLKRSGSGMFCHISKTLNLTDKEDILEQQAGWVGTYVYLGWVIGYSRQVTAMIDHDNRALTLHSIKARAQNSTKRFYNVTFISYWVRKWSKGNVQMNVHKWPHYLLLDAENGNYCCCYYYYLWGGEWINRIDGTL